MSGQAVRLNVGMGQFFTLFILFIVFLVLKLTDVLGWSWWWVTSPLWGPWAFIVAILGILWIVRGAERLGQRLTR